MKEFTKLKSKIEVLKTMTMKGNYKSIVEYKTDCHQLGMLDEITEEIASVEEKVSKDFETIAPEMDQLERAIAWKLDLNRMSPLFCFLLGGLIPSILLIDSEATQVVFSTVMLTLIIGTIPVILLSMYLEQRKMNKDEN